MAKPYTLKTHFHMMFLHIHNLKVINDTKGHLVGDEYIKEAASRLQNAFKPAKIYRIGGDEFAVILQGPLYRNREFVVAELIDDSYKALSNDGCVIALGLSAFNPNKDSSFADVFLRADMAMYENKAKLKSF